MNEAETRAELIDPKLKESRYGVIEGSKILREYPITAGKNQAGGGKTISACTIPNALQRRRCEKLTSFSQAVIQRNASN